MDGTPYGQHAARRITARNASRRKPRECGISGAKMQMAMIAPMHPVYGRIDA
jgi:hypothetical protein